MKKLLAFLVAPLAIVGLMMFSFNLNLANADSGDHDQDKMSYNDNDSDSQFVAHLTGDQEVPRVYTDAEGHGDFDLNDDENELEYELHVSDIKDVTDAHLHCGAPGENGPVVIDLFNGEKVDYFTGTLSSGTADDDDIAETAKDCDDPIHDFEDFVEQLKNGDIYANVHTKQHPAGEIRGQLEMNEDYDNNGNDHDYNNDHNEDYDKDHNNDYDHKDVNKDDHKDYSANRSYNTHHYVNYNNDDKNYRHDDDRYNKKSDDYKDDHVKKDLKRSDKKDNDHKDDKKDHSDKKDRKNDDNNNRWSWMNWSHDRDNDYNRDDNKKDHDSDNHDNNWSWSGRWNKSFSWND